MPDLKTRILEVLQKPQLAGLATITEDGRPWVRYVMAVGGGDMKIRFATFIHARKVAQIKKNPEVHLTCGISDPHDLSPYLQVQGRAEMTTDKEERHGFWNDELKAIFKGPDDPGYGVIIVMPYRIEYCSPGKFEPEIWSEEGNSR